MPSCTSVSLCKNQYLVPVYYIFFLNHRGYYNKNGGLHNSPTVFTSERMGGQLSSNLSISHSTAFPMDTQISCQDFHHLFVRDFHLGFLSQLPYSSTKWMGVFVLCPVVSSYPVCRDPFIRHLDKTSLF